MWHQKYKILKAPYLLGVGGSIKNKTQRNLNFEVKWKMINLNPKHWISFLLSYFGKCPVCVLALEKMACTEILNERHLTSEAQIPSKAKQSPKGLSQRSYQHLLFSPLHSSEAKGKTEWMRRKCNHPSHRADQNPFCGNHTGSCWKKVHLIQM